MKRVLLFTLLFFCFNQVWAHKDFFVEQKFGNVYVRLKTGFLFEEISKVWIVGELAHQLCEKRNYKKPVFIDISHFYVGVCESDYFISYDKGEILYLNSSSKVPREYLHKDGLVIRQVATVTNIKKTLQLVEYAIINQKDIAAKQEKLQYNQNYTRWEINSIDTLVIAEYLRGEDRSEIFCEVINQQVFLVDTSELKYDYSYYYQDGQNYVFYRGHKGPIKVMLNLEQVFQIEPVQSSMVMVFDTDSSFFCLNQYNGKVSKRHIIHNVQENYRPYEITWIGGDMIFMHCSYYSDEPGIQPRQRYLAYLPDEDMLIQDLKDALIVPTQDK